MHNNGAGGTGHMDPDTGGWTFSATNGGNSGGDGGDATAILNGNSSAYGLIQLSGGDGGDATGGGKGGDVYLTVNGNLSADNITFESGKGGIGGGNGGSATVTISGSLIAEDILIRAGTSVTGAGLGLGALSVNVGTLDVTRGYTYLGLFNTSASNVVFHNINLGGGYTLEVDGSNDFHFDTLNVYGSAVYETDAGGGLNAAGKALNFYVPESMSNGGTMLTVIGAADITGSTVNVGIDGRSSPLKAGDSVTLIDATDPASSLTGAPSNPTANGAGMHGVTLKYEFELDTTTYANQLIARVSKVGANEQSKAFSEGFLSGLALVNQGVDLAADQGMDALWHEARAGAQGRGAFAVLSGGSRRYKTGSHVDVDSFSLMTGIAGDMKLASGELSLGAFFVYGEGDYDTYNSFANAASVRGKGDSDYAGAGVLGRLDFNGRGTGHAYAEASLQAGSVKTDFRGNNLARYKSRSGYYGAHLGTGYVWNLTDKAQFDLYGKYLYARRDSDRVTLSTGDPIRFNAVESHRLRIGGRYSWTTNQIKPYAGLAWEHEFDGKARATAHGYPIDAPKLKGDSGVLELGLIMKPSATTPLTVNFGLQGYTGRNEGVGGNLRVEYRF
ncbi:membrane protein [Betaproteobacteria bacterium]|nr:membrane protein [Betaproteobacteria bacterium]